MGRCASCVGDPSGETGLARTFVGSMATTCTSKEIYCWGIAVLYCGDAVFGGGMAHEPDHHQFSHDLRPFVFQQRCACRPGME